MDALGLADCTSQPQHGTMEESRVFVCDVIEEAVVGQKNDQQIVPNRKGAQAVYERTHTFVSKGKGIELRIFQTIVGHFKRLVAAEGEVGHEPRRICRLLSNGL